MKEIISIVSLILSVLALIFPVTVLVLVIVARRRHCCKKCTFQYAGRCLFTYEEITNLKKPNKCGRFFPNDAGGPI